MLKEVLVLSLSVLSLSGCQHFTENFKTRESGQLKMHAWVLGTKFKNREKNNTIPGKTKVYILGDKYLRMDVYDPFGLVSMGRLILNHDQMSLETINGVSYKGPATKEQIRSFLKVEVSPKDLFALFTQDGFEDEHWSCAIDEGFNKLKQCQSSYYQIAVAWSGSTTQKGTQILLKHPKADLKFKVKSYKELSDPKKSIFEL